MNLIYQVESKPLSRSDLTVGLDMGISDRISTLDGGERGQAR